MKPIIDPYWSQRVAARYLPGQEMASGSASMVHLRMPEPEPLPPNIRHIQIVEDVSYITNHITENHIWNLRMNLHFLQNVVQNAVQEEIRIRQQGDALLERYIVLESKDAAVTVSREATRRVQQNSPQKMLTAHRQLHGESHGDASPTDGAKGIWRMMESARQAWEKMDNKKQKSASDKVFSGVTHASPMEHPQNVVSWQGERAAAETLYQLRLEIKRLQERVDSLKKQVESTSAGDLAKKLQNEAAAINAHLKILRRQEAQLVEAKGLQGEEQTAKRLRQGPEASEEVRNSQSASQEQRERAGLPASSRQQSAELEKDKGTQQESHVPEDARVLLEQDSMSSEITGNVQRTSVRWFSRAAAESLRQGETMYWAPKEARAYNSEWKDLPIIHPQAQGTQMSLDMEALMALATITHPGKMPLVSTGYISPQKEVRMEKRKLPPAGKARQAESLDPYGENQGFYRPIQGNDTFPASVAEPLTLHRHSNADGHAPTASSETAEIAPVMQHRREKVENDPAPIWQDQHAQEKMAHRDAPHARAPHRWEQPPGQPLIPGDDVLKTLSEVLPPVLEHTRNPVLTEEPSTLSSLNNASLQDTVSQDRQTEQKLTVLSPSVPLEPLPLAETPDRLSQRAAQSERMHDSHMLPQPTERVLRQIHTTDMHDDRRQEIQETMASAHPHGREVAQPADASAFRFTDTPSSIEGTFSGLSQQVNQASSLADATFPQASASPKALPLTHLVWQGDGQGLDPLSASRTQPLQTGDIIDFTGRLKGRQSGDMAFTANHMQRKAEQIPGAMTPASMHLQHMRGAANMDDFPSQGPQRAGEMIHGNAQRSEGVTRPMGTVPIQGQETAQQANLSRSLGQTRAASAATSHLLLSQGQNALAWSDQRTSASPGAEMAKAQIPWTVLSHGQMVKASDTSTMEKPSALTAQEAMALPPEMVLASPQQQDLAEFAPAMWSSRGFPTAASHQPQIGGEHHFAKLAFPKAETLLEGMEEAASRSKEVSAPQMVLMQQPKQQESTPLLQEAQEIKALIPTIRKTAQETHQQSVTVNHAVNVPIPLRQRPFSVGETSQEKVEVNVDRIVDQVYKQLQRRLRSEQNRRGIW